MSYVISADGNAEAPNVVEPDTPSVPAIKSELEPSVVNPEFLMILPVTPSKSATAFAVELPGPVTSPPPPAVESVIAPFHADVMVIPLPAMMYEVPSINLV